MQLQVIVRRAASTMANVSERAYTRYAIPVSIPSLVARFLIESDEAPSVQWRAELGDRLGANPQSNPEVRALVEDFLATHVYNRAWENVEMKFRIM